VQRVQIWQSVVLGIVEGLTEFLPVSSTGHLTIAEKFMGLAIDDKGVTAYTAIIQVGAILAAVIYFIKDIVKIIAGFVGGLFSAEKRTLPGWRMAINVIVGLIPIVIVGLLLKDVIEGALRSLWFVAAGLGVWSIAIVFGEYVGRQSKKEEQITWKDSLIIGAVQVFALVPGVSRSGATITGGLFRGIDRLAATRLSFFLGIPALAAGGGLEAVSNAKDVSATVGWTAVAVGTAVSFVVAYVSIAWLLRFVSSHSLVNFVWYRVAVAGVLVGLLVMGAITAT
jgi:undecaprenyl-diphosphatase